MIDKDYKLYGTKILNLKTQGISLLICLWENKFADKTVNFAIILLLILKNFYKINKKLIFTYNISFCK